MFVNKKINILFHIAAAFMLLAANIKAQAPGSVSVGLAMWVKSDAGVSVSGSNVTGWTDQKGINIFNVIGTPALQSDNLNYNPTILFNGSSRFVGNTAITVVQGFVVGKITNPSGTSVSGALIGSTTGPGFRYMFHTEGARLYCGGDVTGIYTGFNSPNSIEYNLLSEDFNKTPAASDLIRLNGASQANSAAGDPASFTAIPTLGSRATENIINGSALAEAITYSTSLTAADVTKVESYMAVKYGITLSNSGGGTAGNYQASNGTIIWTAATGSAYHNDVHGIGKDNNSGLLQKQSHQADDSTRIYLGTLAAGNAANTGTFTTTDRQFVMIGNDGGALANTGSTEYPASISGRLTREWKITTTAFTGSLSIDIIPASLCTPVNTNDFRLLIDADGNFTNATVATGVTFSYNAGVLTISGITSTMLGVTATRYLAIATTTLDAGAIASPQNLSIGNTPANLVLSGNGGSIIKWQYSSDNFVNDINDIPSSASSTLTSAQMGPLFAGRFYRAEIMNALCITDVASPVFIAVNYPGGVSNNLYMWLKADDGVIKSGSNVSQWNNMTTNRMITQPFISPATSAVSLNSNNINYNPSVVFTGAANQFLTGSYSVTPANPALFFMVVQGASGGSGCCLGPFSLGTGVGYSTQYDGSSGRYSIDVPFGICSTSSNSINELGVLRADFNAVNSTNLSLTAFNSQTNTVCSSATGLSNDQAIYVGARPQGGFSTSRIFRGSMAEVIHYNVNTLPNGATDIRKIESYLAIKYGITLRSDYLNSAAATIYTGTSGSYSNHIIGVARDDASALNQLQSRQVDDTVRVYLNNLAASNSANAGTFSSDLSSVVLGSDNGRMCSRPATSLEVPAGVVIRINKEWKVTNTNFSSTFSMDFKLSSCAALTNNTSANLVLLVDDDGNFSNATAYSAGGGLSFSYSNPVITVSGISTALIPSGATRFITIGATGSSPLPVELQSFEASCADEKVLVEWRTLSERNCAYYTVESSSDGINWNRLGSVKGSGTTSIPKKYEYMDHAPAQGINYYRLRQTDFDGGFSDFNIVYVDDCNEIKSVPEVFPNPFENTLNIKGKNLSQYTIFNALGQPVNSGKIDASSKGELVTTVTTSELSPGIYFICLYGNSKGIKYHFKLLK